MSGRNSVEYTILDAKGGNGAGKAIFCRDFRHAVFSVASDGGADAALTVKFQGAINPVNNAAPAFGSAQAVDNMWDYKEVIDLENGSAINGDVGIPFTGGDDYREVELNINGLEYLNAIVSARTQGEVTVKVRLYND